MSATPASLQAFVSFCQGLKGDEKGESQTFLDRFFRAFGHEGAIEAGAEFEDRLKKSSAKGKTGFADLVWRSRQGVPGVLIEMKKRGEDLSKHYAQVERYWMRITPNRPRYAMLCNFDEFWIFDFENQVDEPVDKISLAQLPERSSALTFMEIGGMRPVFQNNQVEVTDRSARRLGELYQLLYERGKHNGFDSFSEEQLQRFVLQCVLAMFAEDRGLLPRDIFVSLIQDCMTGGSTYDLIGGLFSEMNRRGKTPAGRYQGVDYFNGGLFAIVDPIELTHEELKFLDVCARDNWTYVRPSIFGNIFEGAIDQSKRHAHGIHFTSEVDIRQIVRPTISDFWEERINGAGSIAELNALQLELQAYRVLDPACGSGNFLYVAYQELKRMEKLLIDKIAERKRSDTGQMAIGYVTPNQFFGMDTNSFAVQLARVTMMIGRKIAIDKLGLFEPALPLDTLDQNIVCKDALFSEWEKADAIIGNPPFLGGARMRQNLGDDYVDRMFKKFSILKNQQVDFATYWFRLAHEHLKEDGRAGLVGTNSISQGKSRNASLDYIVQNGGYIHDAISSQPWSGEAKVHVSLVNWMKQKPHVLHLDNQVVKVISSSLKSGVDVSRAIQLSVNLNQLFRGVEPNGKGFFIDENTAKVWLDKEPSNQVVLKRFSMGANLAQEPQGKPDRWIIDFDDMSIEDASSYKLPFEYIRNYVKPERAKSREAFLKERWWQYRRNNKPLRNAIAGLSHYFAVPRVSKWAVFISVPSTWLPGEKSVVFTSNDFYVLGILTSNVHRTWMDTQKSTLKADIAYTPTTCFETFPFPQSPSAKLIEQIRNAALTLHEYRIQQMEKKQWGITQLYNQWFHEPSSQLAKHHTQLDALVLKAYGFSKTDDILTKLLDLNQQLAHKETQGEPIIGPWAPTDSQP
ncbi:DNA methyltransferase [Phormidesmis sp. 146-12]